MNEKSLWICHSRIEHIKHLNWHLTERKMYGKNKKRYSSVMKEKDKTKTNKKKIEKSLKTRQIIQMSTHKNVFSATTKRTQNIQDR